MTALFLGQRAEVVTRARCLSTTELYSPPHNSAAFVSCILASLLFLVDGDKARLDVKLDVTGVSGSNRQTGVHAAQWLCEVHANRTAQCTMHTVGAFLFFLVHGRILLEQCHRRLTESINEVTPTVWPLLECAGIPKSAAHLNEMQSVDVAVLKKQAFK